MPITFAAGESKQLNVQMQPMPAVALQLIDAYFDNGLPMTKKPGDTFTVTVQIKNNLAKDWSPGNIVFGFGPGAPNTVIEGFTFASIVWGRNWVTGEVDPLSCWVIGYWPLATWPIIPSGATKTFQTTFGLCPGAPAGTYDGCVQMWEDKTRQLITMPNILTVVWPKPKVAILNAVLRDCRVGIKYGVYKIYGTVDLTIKNDEGRYLTWGLPDDINIEFTIFRREDNAKVGFVRVGKRDWDIPPGTNTLAFTPSIGFGSDVPLSPGTLNYRIVIKIIFGGWPGDPYIQAEFSGTTTLA